MKRVLLIAFHFPPVRGSSGLQRTLAFSRYLPEFGWQPSVLTADPRAYEATGDDQLKYLGQAKNRVEKVISAMERYDAVETRLRMQYGVTKFDLVTVVEQIRERIRAARPRRGLAGRPARPARRGGSELRESDGAPAYASLGTLRRRCDRSGHARNATREESRSGPRP